MKIEFFGAVGTVTGSRFLVSTDSTRVLVDCGQFQGVKVLRRRNWKPPGFDPRDVDAVVLTHAHLDHSGYLPVLVRDGFEGPIHCTRPTGDLCRILLPDAGRIAEEEARYANRKGFSRHSPARPLFTEADANTALGRFRPQSNGDEVVVGDLTFSFTSAGHILGASSVLVRHGDRTALFSGDLGRPDDLLIHPPDPPPAADVVVMESTYGGRLHAEEDLVEALAAVARRTFERGGVLLVPAFAVGRAQAVLYALDQAFSRGLVPRVPLYLNSPMASRVVDLYLDHPDEHRLSAMDVGNLMGRVEFVDTVDDSRELNLKRGPMAIVSASGMLAGGRVLHHVRAFGHDPNTTILLAGYQAAGTRGAALLAGAPTVKIHGTSVVIRAEVARLDGFSAHADQGELVAWLSRIPKPPREVLLVHGEPEAADALRQRIESDLGFPTRAAEEHDPVEV